MFLLSVLLVWILVRHWCIWCSLQLYGQLQWASYCNCFLQPKRRMPSDSTTTIAKTTSAILEHWNFLISSRPDQYTYSAAISACDGGALFFLRFYSRKISKKPVSKELKSRLQERSPLCWGETWRYAMAFASQMVKEEMQSKAWPSLPSKELELVTSRLQGI